MKLFVCFVLLTAVSASRLDTSFINEDGGSHSAETRKISSSLKPSQIESRVVEFMKKMVDRDADGYISRFELQTFMNDQSHAYAKKKFYRTWKAVADNVDGAEITWNTYKKQVYSPELAQLEHINPEFEQFAKYRDDINLQKLRFQAADQNSNKKLDKEEFFAFLFPEFVHRMHNLAVHEAFKQMDVDANGRVSMKEYIDEAIPNHRGDNFFPHWVEAERRIFFNADVNEDDELDLSEAKEIIRNPHEYGITKDVKRLIYAADLDHDDMLAIKTEVRKMAPVFVKSRITDYGEAIMNV